MRILQILDVRWDSGIMRYGLSLAAALKERGHDVRVWALPGKPPYVEAEKLGLQVSSCESPALRFAALRRELIERPVEVVNAHSGSGHTLAGLLNLTLKDKFALVRTRGDARPLVKQSFSGWLWARTHGFIAGNHAILEAYREAIGGAAPSKAVAWGLDWPDPGAPDAGTPPRVGMAARLDAVKGHATLLEAMSLVRKTVPNAELLLAGAEVGITKAQLDARAAELGLGSSVHVLGHVGRMQNFFRTCHVGVVASLGSEAVSRAAVEWLASGRPVVATTVGCLPETVKDGKTGRLVPPGDAAALAAAITPLLTDAAARETMGLAARKDYEARFRTERFVKDTIELYEYALHDIPRR